jgi:hypothetical protein
METHIRIFVLHCFESTLSTSKGRPESFDRKSLWDQVVQSRAVYSCNETLKVSLTSLLDESKRNGRTHFCEERKTEMIQGGSGSTAFAAVLHKWMELSRAEHWKDDDIVVLLEDDYAVKGPWIEAVGDGLQFGHYVTLYDHPDKYSSLYTGTPSQVFAGKVCHWRTTPSTTNSFATRWKTLREDVNHHLPFTTPHFPAVRDHARWLHLWQHQRMLVSSLPGFWSHEEAGMQSPLFHQKRS